MMTREEAYAARPPIAWDSVEGWLRRYALAYCNLLLAQERSDQDPAIPHWRDRCDECLAKLAEQLPLGRFAFETDEARRYGEEEAAQARALLRRIATS